MRKIFLINFFLAAFLVLGFMLEKSDYFAKTKEALQKITLPSTPLKLGKRLALLEKMGLTYVFPKDYFKFYDPDKHRFHFENIVSLDSTRADYRRDWTGHRQIPPESYPSSNVLDRRIIDSGVPILSVVVGEKDLYDPKTGIIENRTVKGKVAERPCFISYYDRGELLFATGAGIRIHGGTKNKRESESLRIYFRKAYGHDQFKPGIIFDEKSIPIKQVIARIEYNYASLLALDIAKRIGCLAPEGLPVSVYLNGKKYGHRYALTEHLDEDWLRSRYGHDNFVLLRTTGHREERRRSVEYQRLVRWVNDKDIAMTMAEVGKYVDIENLSRWFISQFFTAGYDMYQGPLLRDRTKPDAKWFWVNWDMDQSFRNTNEPEKSNIWEQEVNFHNVMRNPKQDRKNPKTGRFQYKDPRAILFRRMHNEDPDFKKYFEQLFMNVMNHKLTHDFLKTWVDSNEQVITPLATDDEAFFDQLRQFVQHRPAYLRQLMQKYFGSSESYLCRITGPSHHRYEIDGFATGMPYEGWYFKGSDITITVEAMKGERLSHWMVNGEPVATSDHRFDHRVDETTVMKPVFSR